MSYLMKLCNDITYTVYNLEYIFALSFREISFPSTNENYRQVFFL